MLSFSVNHTIFMVRTAGIALRDGHVLPQRLQELPAAPEHIVLRRRAPEVGGLA